MRPYEKLKTIYEIASRMIVRGEGTWKDYLSFAARIHKYSFDNALLVYAQNPDVTTLASIPQWNKVGRNVNRRICLTFLKPTAEKSGFWIGNLMMI